MPSRLLYGMAFASDDAETVHQNDFSTLVHPSARPFHNRARAAAPGHEADTRANMRAAVWFTFFHKHIDDSGVGSRVRV